MEKDECKCGSLARMAEDPKNSVEFDARLNEYHIRRADGSGYSLIYFCPFCGGNAPKSERASLSQRLTDAERQRLGELTKDLRTVQDVIAAFGEPDTRRPIGMTVVTPEKEGAPETTLACPVMTYTRLSDVADVHVTVYPADKVGISFQGKPILVQQRQELRIRPAAKPPEPEPQIDTSRRYDVYCAEPYQKTVVYRNARFKGAGSLLLPAGAHAGFSQFVELEQANGQSVFISRGSILRFCGPGTELAAEVLAPK
jgi:hypothetical protein